MNTQYKRYFGLPVGLACMLSLATSSAASETLNQDVGVLVEDVAQVAIAGLGVPAFTVSASATAGGAPVVAKDPYDRYLQYTSIAPQGETRAIQAQVTTPLPTGMVLRLSTPETSGTGQVGVAQFIGSGASALTLSTTAADLVTGIGTGYTGDGASDGLLLNYELVLDEQIDQVYAGMHSLEVTFTLAATGGL